MNDPDEPEGLLDEGAPPIEVVDLTSRFGENVIHEGLNLTVKRGQIMGVVGGSGGPQWPIVAYGASLFDRFNKQVELRR